MHVYGPRQSQGPHRGQYPAILTEQAWSIKDLLYVKEYCLFSTGTQQVIPNGQDGAILPTRVANHSAGFGSSCPLAELAIMMLLLSDKPNSLLLIIGTVLFSILFSL